MTDSKIRLETPVIIAGIIGGYIFGTLSLWITPVFVGEFMHAYGISEQEVGLSIGLQAGGIALVSLYGSYKVDVLQFQYQFSLSLCPVRAGKA